MALPLHTHATVTGVVEPTIVKVVDPAEAGAGMWPGDRVLTWDGAAAANADLGITLSAPRNPDVVRPGDVIRLRPSSSQVQVLFRRGANSNALFATERCNSMCLMCSQPPRDEDDAWRVRELLQLVPLIDKDLAQLGVTGGEPTLLGEGLGLVIDACARELPDTHLHILTNGRRFANPLLTELLAARDPARVTWAVPLYSDTASIHDHVVQAADAWSETIAGLTELAKRRARVEIRVVLHKLTVPRLEALAAFIYRNLPFAEHVALMGLEPMGFARGNREQLWIDPADYLAELGSAAFHLANRGMNVSIYNLPLCVLPPELWRFARQSISDWKNIHAPECNGCIMKDSCAGFFTSAGTDWRSRLVKPIEVERAA